MKESTNTRSARQRKTKVSTPAPQQSTVTNPRPIRIGDLVDYVPLNGTERPGRVVAVYPHEHQQGPLVVWQAADGTFDSWFAEELRVIEPAPASTDDRLPDARSDSPDRIEIGDVVATRAGQGGDVGGVVVAVFDDVVVFKTDTGSFDVQDRDGLFVVSKAQPLTPAGPQEPITGKTHRFEVGDLVTDANNDCADGIVIAVFRHDFGQGDVVVWMHVDGTCSCWYSHDVELVARGPAEATSKMIELRRVDLYPPGSDGQKADLAVADRSQLHRLLGVKELRQPGDQYSPATIERMTAAAHNLERARQLVQQLEDLIVTPTMSPDEIGWDWADTLPADWAFAHIRALHNEISDLQMSARCAIAIKANEGTRGAA